MIADVMMIWTCVTTSGMPNWLEDSSIITQFRFLEDYTIRLILVSNSNPIFSLGTINVDILNSNKLLLTWKNWVLVLGCEHELLHFRFSWKSITIFQGFSL